MSKVLVSAPFPFSLRNFVASGLCSRLARDLGEVVVLSPYDYPRFTGPDGAVVRNIHLPAKPGEWGIPKPKQVGFIDEQMKFLHMAGFAQEYPDGSLQMMIMGTNQNARWWLARLLRAIAPRGTSRRAWFRDLIHARRPRRDVIETIFDEEQPELVLVASPGHYWGDQFVLEEAARRKIPSLCVVLSWDNMYSRGPLVRRPDYMAVWSRAMRRQAEQVQDFPSDRIHEVGALQFGHYSKPVDLDEDRRMRASIGLSPEDAYIAYVCGSRTAIYDVEDIRQLLEIVNSSEFKELKIVVRPHPQGDRREYAKLSEVGVLIDASPDLTDEKTKPDAVDYGAIRHMAAFLSGAKFVMSSWGTTALLEATLLDQPSIQFRWMDSVRHSKESEVDIVRKFQRYLHIRDFDEHGARLYSDSPSDLVENMRRLMDNNEEFSKRRKNLVESLVKLPLDGCVDRVARLCDMILGSKQQS
jgi:hypothetical protein